MTEYECNGFNYRLEELKKAKQSSIEFILLYQLFLSDRTGKVINKDFLKLTFPGRWRYDILKALDYLQYSKEPWDERMEPALGVLLKKETKMAPGMSKPNILEEYILRWRKPGDPVDGIL